MAAHQARMTDPSSWDDIVATVLSKQEGVRREGRFHFLRGVGMETYSTFRAEAWPLLADHARSDWGVAFAMQHFSLPTRLLDRTESLACAVFFAQLDRDPDEAAAIWVLDPGKLNGLAGLPQRVGLLEGDVTRPNITNTSQWHPGVVAPEEQLKTIAVEPVYTHARMVQQKARFTLMGDSFLPLDEQYEGGLIRGGHLTKLILAPETYEAAENFLSASGLDAFSFFPDLQGLALKHKLKVKSDLRLYRRPSSRGEEE